ncbi:hypothetical protein B0I35DRAFT_473088 [Stachybotrys elegans]|uniref:Uncharacterized protein n=1 Tax=Stachybotrys elegans TaxID=80388 RepID=A0A8K0WXD1_9HYPO|nr:hypothetical protein B0I35DRAFT_473088 [Stachybotrys elegans]
MPSASAPATTPAAPAGLGDNKGIKFEIRAGTARWQCTLQDRSHYERTKATRSNSTDSIDSNASTSTTGSH